MLRRVGLLSSRSRLVLGAVVAAVAAVALLTLTHWPSATSAVGVATATQRPATPGTVTVPPASPTPLFDAPTYDAGTPAPTLAPPTPAGRLVSTTPRPVALPTPTATATPAPTPPPPTRVGGGSGNGQTGPFSGTPGRTTVSIHVGTDHECTSEAGFTFSSGSARVGSRGGAGLHDGAWTFTWSSSGTTTAVVRVTIPSGCHWTVTTSG